MAFHPCGFCHVLSRTTDLGSVGKVGTRRGLKWIDRARVGNLGPGIIGKTKKVNKRLYIALVKLKVLVYSLVLTCVSTYEADRLKVKVREKVEEEIIGVRWRKEVNFKEREELIAR